MQLKLRRSQREAGLLGKTVLFCLDARVEFTPAESQSVTRYRLQSEIIYSSDAQKRAAEGMAQSAANAKGQGVGFTSVDSFIDSSAAKIGHGMKAVALGALAAMRLTITISSLERGQHIECKSLDELLLAEQAIMEACGTLRSYLDAAATFDGGETVYDFSASTPRVVAMATSPEPMLAAPALASPAVEPPYLTTADHGATEQEPSVSEYPPSRKYVAGAFDDARGRLTNWWQRLDRNQRLGAALAVLVVLIVIFKLL